jgi:hypothetical protein
MPEGPPPAPRAPSDPKPLPMRGGADWGGAPGGGFGPPARFQMIAVVLLGVALVAVPLYLWRRPRAVPDATTGDAAAPDGEVLDAAFAIPDEIVDAAPDSGLRLSDPRVLECRDPGSKKVPTEQCDALAGFTKSFNQAIVTAKDCVPQSAGPGTITYVADVSFSKHHAPVTISLPKDGRSYKGMKAIGTCAAAVRSAVSGLSLENQTHAHAHYKIAVTVTYPPRASANAAD